ncbi:AMP-binding protein [Pseudofrankia inefficax]|uniref:AMP-dependent synthetase and ligase n=1 Tax=Pseudofrankia inefficax (strain DSM 45817 / CECT 9037 / DDB 130130 / EuI1c) TaxID=298654 RepID=E3JAN8_PSEI1|nr:AMP-binding protein [Pseudofrankia inefficax]ADP82230.1 AMP-dependent synthetase and ligase [Pseudofrankia inefficax]
MPRIAGSPLPPVHPFVGMDLTTVLAERVRRHPDHPMLIWEPADGAPRTWTYAEFAHDVAATAAGLAGRGVGPGDAVIIHLDNSPGFLQVWFACARLGAVAIDVNTRYAQDELAHAVEITGAVGIVTDPRLGLAGSSTAARLGWIATLDPATGTVPDLFGDPADAPTRAPDPGAPLCVQLTSGTTSRPKAVLYTHANALWAGQLGATTWRLSSDAVQFVYAPLFHTHALCWQFLPTLWAGGTTVLVAKFSASRFWEVSVRNGCTHTGLLGLPFTLLAEQPVPAHSYRSWIFGFEYPQVDARYGLRVLSAWGMTEVVTTPIAGDLDNPGQPLEMGRAAPAYELRIADPTGVPVAPGETGELLVRGVRGLSLFAEYLGDPKATAEAFLDGYFRTGDLVTLMPTGGLKFAGRAKDMLKVSGENVAAAEIERVIAAVAGVTAAAVVGRPDRFRGEVPVAFITAPDVASPTDLTDQILAACRAQLADFKVPHDVYLVDELPRATLDKISKGVLRQWAEQRAEAASSPATR